MRFVNVWCLIDNLKCFPGHFTHYCSRLGLQVNAYLDYLQLSKTVFILAKFGSSKLFISADKGCLILVPRSDLF